jgi:hypothetical protein
MSESDLIVDLGTSIRDLIDTYSAGHEIPVALIVGLLHCIAAEIIIDNQSYRDDDEWEDDDDLRPLQDDFPE